MSQRRTRASSRRAAIKTAAPEASPATRTRRSRRQAEAAEFKSEDPDPDEVADAQTQLTPATDHPEALSGTFLASAGRSASSLSQRLKQMWQALQSTPSRQQQREDGVLDTAKTQQLTQVGAELLQDKVMAHSDKNVRALAACCLVEIMRIQAPDSPFGSNEELYRVFKLLLQQLRALAQNGATTARDLHCLHVLESLATVKSCLLVVGLNYTEEEEEESMLVQLFRALFDTISNDHSAKIENLMLSIMSTCIEESNAIEQPLLDAILSPLLGATPEGQEGEGGGDENTTERSPSHMARELIRRTSEYLQSAMSNFFNSILIGSQGTSKLKEHVYTLIYKVHKINPSLLLYVLPNVCLQLQVDEVATRSEAIALMGKLFASSHADYGHEFMKIFREFLGRFRDASKEIRMQMVQASVAIWEYKTELSSLLEEEFVLRLNDPEWEVRQLVVNELCDFAANRLELISEECLRAVGERMKDKKIMLRKETMTGLSQVFSTHISSYWEEEDEDKQLSLSHRNIPPSHIKKLGWIPDYVLKCYAYPQQELKLRVTQLLDDFLLPKVLPERTRANGLLFIFHSLDATSKEALRRIFTERAKCQEACQRFVAFKAQHRQKGRLAAESDDSALEKARKELHDSLSPLFSDVAKLNKLLDRFSKWKDHSVFKHMGQLCDFSKSQSEFRQARDQLVRSVGSKSPLGEFLKKLCRKLSLLTISQASVAAFLDFLLAKHGRPSRENRSIVELLVMASSTLPELFTRFINDKVGEILVGNDGDANENQSATSDEEDDEGPRPKDPKVVLGALHILANYSCHRTAKPSSGDSASTRDEDSIAPSASLSKQLHELCLGESDDEAQNFNAAKESQAAELAALAIANFYGTAGETADLVDKLCSKEKLGSPEASGALPTLQSLEVFAKRCSHIFSEDKALLSRLWSHLLDDLADLSVTLTPKERKGTKSLAAKVANVRCLAIKVAVNLLVYGQSSRDPADARQNGTKLIKLLFGVLRSDGKAWGSNPSLAANFRAAASCGLLKLMRNRQLEATISVSQWHLLGFTMQDSSEDVRRKFLKKLTSHLMKQPAQHPHKYMSYLALAGRDASSGVKKAARNLLKLAVERMRRMFDAASSRESDVLTSPGQQAIGSPSVSALMVPEYALPYVIHLLAHHPEFPSKLVERSPSAVVLQSSLWGAQLAYLGFFLDGLVSTSARATDNIAFLLQILAKISQCHDVMTPQSKHIYPLIDSTAVLLKKKIKNQSNLKPFPGKIFLPKHLYSPSRPATTSEMRTEPEAPESLDSNNTTPGPGLGDSLLSPIKPADFASHFMRLNSPPGSSLKRKRSLTPSSGSNKGSNAGSTQPTSATPPRRQSLLGQGRPVVRTYVDDSSDSEAESNSQKPQSKEVSAAAAATPSIGANTIAEEKENQEEEEQDETPQKKHKTDTSTPAEVSPVTPIQRPRLRSARRRLQG